jgi:hypothetical protein
MKTNVGATDKTIRIVIGVVFIILAVLTKSWWLVIIGLIPLITGLIGYCPLYTLLGISTCKVKTDK